MDLTLFVSGGAAATSVLAAFISVWQARIAGDQAESARRQARSSEDQVLLLREQLAQADRQQVESREEQVRDQIATALSGMAHAVIEIIDHAAAFRGLWSLSLSPTLKSRRGLRVDEATKIAILAILEVDRLLPLVGSSADVVRERYSQVRTRLPVALQSLSVILNERARKGFPLHDLGLGRWHKRLDPCITELVDLLAEINALAGEVAKGG